MMMEVEQPRAVNPAMTFDEVSMERSKSFVKALQELKNLRPQLYTAAEYCEKSYLNSDQKEMVLENLKDYALRALVNAVDHLGTVAYKLTDLLEQQKLEVSTMELNVSCLNQRLLTCQMYMNSEGLRQQQLLAFIPRHHKQYILPSNLAPKNLSWHLASETKTTLKGIPHASTSSEEPKISGKTSGVFHLSDNEKTTRTNSPAAHLQFPSGGSPSSAIMQTLSGTRRDGMESSQALTRYRSFENQNRRDIARVPVRSKSILSAFFVKQKTPKLKAGSVL